MKKLLLSLVFTLATLLGWSQCTVTTVSATNTIPCGTCVEINAIGQSGVAVMNNDFNSGIPGNGWAATTAATFTNPCGPGPDGSYMWMGSNSPAPRILTTNGLDMSCGGQVCFDIKLAIQSDPSPCEGPDTPTEGVYFDYSIDGGVTWTTVNYFNPGGGYDPIMTTWNNYCYTIPNGAWTPNTMFRWAQTNTSSNLYDHWGMDNVVINSNDCGYWFDWTHPAPLAMVGDSSYGGSVCPPGDTTYTVMYTNGIDDTCYSSIDINTTFPTVTLTAQQNPITNCDGCTELNASIDFGTIPYNWTWLGNGHTPIDTRNVTACPTTSGWHYIIVSANGCSDIDSIYLTANPPSPTTLLTDTVCAGSNYTFPDNTTQTNIVSNVTYNSTVQTVSGCDSIITTNLTVSPNFTQSTTTSICNGGNYTFIDGFVQNNITTPISHLNPLTSINGCDSLITENIVINPNYTVNVVFTQCPNLPFTFPDGVTLNNVTTNVTHISNLTTVFGCDSIVTTDVIIHTVPPVDIILTPNGCSPLMVSMTNSVAGSNCIWEVTGPGFNNTYSGCGTITNTFTNSGVYNVSMSMESTNGCPMVTTNTFTVLPLPTANFSWSPIEGTVLDGTINFSGLSIGAISYEWDFGNGVIMSETNPTYTYTDTGSYKVTLMVNNEWGCSDTISGVVIINDVFLIYVPNAFTPDGYGNNNTFQPVVSGYDTDNFTMTIFNRWGEVIYETKTPQNGWDGTHKGSMVMDGVYIWKILVKTQNNIFRNYIGTVTLLR